MSRSVSPPPRPLYLPEAAAATSAVAPASAPGAAALGVGARVQIMGLYKKPELNGMVCNALCMRCTPCDALAAMPCNAPQHPATSYNAL